MKSNELRRLLESNGWCVKSQSGSHAKFIHQEKEGFIILPLRGAKEIGIGLEKKIKKQAGL